MTASVIESFEQVCSYTTLSENTYYILMANVALKFVVGGLKVDVVRDFHEKHHAVNVTACEFLELMLKSSKDRGCASTVAHLIIDHL